MSIDRKNPLGCLAPYARGLSALGFIRLDVARLARATNLSESVVRNAVAGGRISKASLDRITALIGASDTVASLDRIDALLVDTEKAAPRTVSPTRRAELKAHAREAGDPFAISPPRRPAAEDVLLPAGFPVREFTAAPEPRVNKPSSNRQGGQMTPRRIAYLESLQEQASPSSIPFIAQDYTTEDE